MVEQMAILLDVFMNEYDQLTPCPTRFFDFYT